METYKKVAAGIATVAAVGIGIGIYEHHKPNMLMRTGQAQVQQLDEGTKREIRDYVSQFAGGAEKEPAQTAARSGSGSGHINGEQLKNEVEADVVRDLQMRNGYAQRQIVTNPALAERQDAINVERTYVNGIQETIIIMPAPVNEAFVVYNPTAALIAGIIEGECWGYNFPIWYTYCPTPFMPMFYQPWNTWEYWGGGSYYWLPHGHHFGGGHHGRWREAPRGSMPWQPHQGYNNSGRVVTQPAPPSGHPFVAPRAKSGPITPRHMQIPRVKPRVEQARPTVPTLPFENKRWIMPSNPAPRGIQQAPTRQRFEEMPKVQPREYGNPVPHNYNPPHIEQGNHAFQMPMPHTGQQQGGHGAHLRR